MKKLIALLLVLAMALSLAACGSKNAETPAAPGNSAEAPATNADPNATYTYNRALPVFPTDWNPHTSQTQEDAEIRDYVTSGMYVFTYNDTMDGYRLVPGMAADYPEDVTAEYIGQYGLEEGAENRAWKVTLRDDLKWEDGTPITAKDYEESYKRLMAPEAQNYRADGTYTGNMVIHNAENYVKQGKVLDVVNQAALSELKKGADGVYADAEGRALYLSLTNTDSPNNGGMSLTDIHDAGYMTDDVFNALSALAVDGKIPYTDEARETLYKFTGSADWGNEEKSTLETYAFYSKEFGAVAFEDVGVKALSDTELLYVLDKPLDGFYLHYSLTDSYLVKTDLYDSLAKVNNGVYTNTYGTSAETTMSFGPYKLTSFQADKQFVMERNEYFYNLDGKYQATAFVTDFVPEAATRLELFLQGKLDEYQLTADDMETYSLSDYTYYATGDTTFAMCLNPSLDKLTQAQQKAGAGINKTILTLPEFRQAMSLAMDRKNFALAVAPTNNAAFALFSSKIISDPDAGTTYRSTDVAKSVMAQFWGVSEDYGSGKLYADIDEAIESITGYNLPKAQELFNAAYDKAIEQGLMTETDKVEIKVGTPNATSQFYNNGYEYIVNNYTEAVKGTKLEGKLTFALDNTLGNGFAQALQTNQVDMLFGVGWTGSALDPYSLIEAYVSTNYQYDSNVDYTKIKMTVAIDGKDYTASIWDWYQIMMGTPTDLKASDGTKLAGYKCGYSDKDPETRLQILGELEGAILMNFNFIPLIDKSQAELKGQQIEFKTEEYLFPMEFGGVEYYTFNYTDAEWDAYVASNGGTLDYT